MKKTFLLKVKLVLIAFCMLTSINYVSGQITISLPFQGQQIKQCSNYTLYYHANSGFSTYVVVEVHQDNLSGPIVKTYTNASGAYYFSQDYNNSIASDGLSIGNYQIKVYDYYNPSNYGVSGIFSIVSMIAPALNNPMLIGSTYFEMSWSSNSATTFRITVSEADYPNFTNVLTNYNDLIVPGSSAGGYYVNQSIKPGTYYYVRVKSVKSTCISPFSVYKQVLTLPEKPDLHIVEAKLNSFAINWQAVKSVSQYFVDVSTSNSFTPSNTVTTTVNTNAYSSPTNLLTGGTYYVRVRCSNNSGSVTSNTLVVHLCSTPAPPTISNNPIVITPSYFEIKWSGTADSYVIDAAKENSNFDVSSILPSFYNLNVVPPGNTGYYINNLEGGTNYYCRVRSIQGSCISTNSTIGPILTLPSIPTLSTTSITNNSFSISWQTIKSVSQFFIDVSSDSTFPAFNTITSTSNTNTFSSPTNLTYQAIYFVRVRCQNASGWSQSSPLQIKICAPPSPPVANPATVVTQTGFTANWNSVTGATSYYLSIWDTEKNIKVQYRGPFDGTVGTSGTPDLEPSKNYYYYVQAQGCNLSNPSNIIDVYTADMLTPSNIQVQKVVVNNFVHAKISWAQVSGANQYELVIENGVNEIIDRIIVPFYSYSGYDYYGLVCATSYSILIRGISKSGIYSSYGLKTISNYCSSSGGRIASSVNDNNVGQPESNYVIFPNPTRTILNIVCPKGMDMATISVSIYDIHGQQVSVPEDILSDRIEMNVEKINDGLYFVIIRSGDNIFLRKLIKN